MFPFLLGNRDEIDGCDVKGFENFGGYLELPFSAVDDEKIAKVVFFLLPKVMTEEHFAHRRIVVGFPSFYLEEPHALLIFFPIDE